MRVFYMLLLRYEKYDVGGVVMSVLEQKKQIVADVAEKLTNSKATVIVDYRGLSVAEVTELRKELREAGIEFKVYKNTLARRASEKANLAELSENLVGPTA